MKKEFLLSVVSNGVRYYRVFDLREPETISEDFLSCWTTDISKAKPVDLPFAQFLLGLGLDCSEFRLEPFPDSNE